MSKTIYLLTGDIGGTNSRMGLYQVNSTDPLVVKYYRNQDFLTSQVNGIFENKIIAPFLKHCWEEKGDTLVPLDEGVEIVACLAIAGPVRGNQVSMSNLHNIVIDGDAIKNQTYAKSDPFLATIKVCKIINDFVAQGYGCLTLQEHEAKELTSGAFKKIDPTGPKVCVGAGTGLGECFLTPDSNGVYSCFPSEGGHVEWAPRNDLESKLWKYLKQKFSYKNRVSVERVVSGRGLANCYEFLAKEFPGQVDPKMHADFEAAGDLQGKVVSQQGHAKAGSLGAKALEIMCGAYGSECGSAAIKFIPTGGLYVTGGLTPKNMKFIEGQGSPFMKAYMDKGRVSPLLDNVPLFAVQVEDLGVRGALKSAQLECERYNRSTSGSIKSEKKLMAESVLGKRSHALV